MQHLESLPISLDDIVTHPVQFLHVMELQGLDRAAITRTNKQVQDSIKSSEIQLTALLEQETKHRNAVQHLIYTGFAVNLFLATVLIFSCLHSQCHGSH